METLFALCNAVVLPFWIPAIFAPRWSWTHRIVRSPWVALPPALIYAGLILPQMGAVLTLLLDPAGPQLESVRAGLATAEGSVLAWAHLVTFDLFTGRWIFLDARERRVPAVFTSPCLLLTFVIGPVGLLLYLAARGLGRHEGASGGGINT